MCRLRNIALRDYQESVTIGQTDTRTHRQTPDKVIPMCRYASQATQRDHPLTMANMSAKFDEEVHNGLVSMVFTSLFPYMSIMTLTFDLENQ